MGAGGVAPLVFLGDSGPGAWERLREQLARRGLGLEDLLRLRLFGADGAGAEELRQSLERELPRERWPALSVVAARTAERAQPALDAIASPCGREKQSLGPQAVRLGRWLFIGALSSPNTHALSPAERIRREAGDVFAEMERLLRAGGARLSDVVRVGGWLSFPMSDYEPLARVREELLERCALLPASAAVQVAASGGGPLLAFEAIAFAGHSGERARPSSLAPYYARARSAGGYVFTCGEIPRERGSLEREVRDVCEQLGAHLSEHGALPRDVVQQTVFVRDGEDTPVVERELAAWLGSGDVPTTVVRTIDMGFRAGVNVEVELVVETAPVLAEPDPGARA